MTPLMQRRIAQFKQNRRGYISLWIISICFAVTLFAELLANDKPILIVMGGEFYAPVLAHYTEADFGGDFDTEPDYRDPYVQELITQQGGWVLWPLIRHSYHSINYDIVGVTPSPPASGNWLGTDDQGRDILARLIYGFRISLLFGLCLTLGASVIGVCVGAMQGFMGGWVDLLGQRFIEVWSGMPVLYVLMILSAIVEPNFFWLLGLMLAFSWMSLVGVVRAECLKVRNYDYVKAASLLGVPRRAVLLRHVLPNALVAALAFLPFILSGSITALTSLDFLGFGMPPGTPSLGEMLLQAKANPHAWWIGLSSFAVLTLMLSCLVFVGEGLRDAFHPHRKMGA